MPAPSEPLRNRAARRSAAAGRGAPSPRTPLLPPSRSAPRVPARPRDWAARRH